MNVLKFGGSSVGSLEAVLNVKKIVESRQENVVVVVSALGGVTDMLITMANKASKSDETYTTDLETTKLRHYKMIDDVVQKPMQKDIRGAVESMFFELENLLHGVSLLKDLSPRTMNALVSYGERLSSTIVSGIIKNAELFDARELIKTEYKYNRAVVDFDLTSQNIIKAFNKMPKVSIVGGFISSDKVSGEATNLGRGGSDYTASILASVLDADKLEIWTDVDGFMTADPRIINNAYVIEKLSFIEAMELCNFGAKVIYPPTIFPVYHKNIPIVIKNTFNPEASGTLISREKGLNENKNKAIKGISSIDDTSLITIQGLGMVGVIGVNYRIFRALSKAGISVFLVSQASSENTTSIGVKNADAELAAEVLRHEFRDEIDSGEINKIKVETDLATLAIVGENMKYTPGVSGKLFGVLGRNGINVVAVAQGASETNISLVVALADLRKAINVIHDSFFLAEYQVLNVFVAGIGTVGGKLLEQIRKQQEILLKQNSLAIRVVGISNSRKAIFDRNGIDLSSYKEKLEASDFVSNAQTLKDEIRKMNIFNSVFVDCTASADVSSIYESLIEHNISVVTANKLAASGEYESYLKLKQEARKRGIKFLFETNVGAGLPVINTINALINSGDKILKIEAVVSGTLNFIFSKLDENTPLSKVIRMAKDEGYSEPDPRIDLSGTDVIRKLVILAREAGYKLNQEDVKKSLFIPEKYFEGTVDDFWKNIPNLDAEFEQKRKAVAAQGKRWCFMAELDNGKGEVKLAEIDSSHPFYNLEGSNNIILLTTERYKEYPMQIKGYGAGASVTAAGVFSDIISIANIR